MAKAPADGCVLLFSAIVGVAVAEGVEALLHHSEHVEHMRARGPNVRVAPQAEFTRLIASSYDHLGELVCTLKFKVDRPLRRA